MYKHEIPSPIPNPRLPPGCTDSDFTHLYANKTVAVQIENNRIRKFQCDLTLSQTTNFRLSQTERVCRQ